MANNIIYGVDVSKEITPIMIRNAILDCFLKAHNNVLDKMINYSDFKTEEEFMKI